MIKLGWRNGSSFVIGFMMLATLGAFFCIAVVKFFGTAAQPPPGSFLNDRNLPKSHAPVTIARPVR